MNKRSALRLAPHVDGVSIWSSEIFGNHDASLLRDFLARAFSVREVAHVELRRATASGRVRYDGTANHALIWKKLGRALRTISDRPTERIDADFVFLDGPDAASVSVTRIGNALTTWRVRHHSENTLLLWHPYLRNRHTVVFRLEEELAAILGVESFRASALTGGVSIRFDKGALTLERLVKQLEKSWPRLLKGLDGPPSRKRLVAAVGLLGLAFTGQYIVPPVRPIAVAGVALYSLPNVVNAVKQLRRGEVGIYTLYTTGLGFMLYSGMPFASTVIAVLMQFWPQLARSKVVSSQRRLFAAQRRRPAWVRLAGGTRELEVSVDELRKGDLIAVGRGEIIAVDGVVADGFAAVAEPFSGGQIEDKAQGDAVAAGTRVHEGSLAIRVERVGAQTAASYVDSLLPHGVIAGLPSVGEVERVANRNAKPALALSVANLAVTRTLRASQALIRPDYLTGPRLSAQLSALHAVAQGLRQGVLFRDPAALDRLADADVYVIDDSAGLDQRRIEVAKVETAAGVGPALVVSYALAAHRQAGSDRSAALATFAANHAAVQPNSISRHAGATRYRDGAGSTIEIATEHYLNASQIELPKRFQKPSAKRNGVDLPTVRPLWVLRDGKVIGLVSFAHSGELIGKQVVPALKAQNPRARIVYVSRAAQSEARRLADTLGIELAYGDLSQAAKLGLIRGLGRNTVWIGDGSDPEVTDSIAASTVSVSVAPLSQAREDAADILLPRRGLAGLPSVIELARAHATRLARDYRTVYSANLLGIAGAFGARFSSLQVGLLSNLGTGLVYARRARDLNRLAASLDPTS